MNWPVAIDTANGVLVSPCDSRLSAIGRVPGDGWLEQVKGETYGIDALLGSRDDAARFHAGHHATLYLSPAMYHRVHSPVDGEVVAWRYVPGRLFPVNVVGVRSVPGLFTRNVRIVVLVETEAHGPVAIVLVGAANVGRISLAFAELVTNRGHAQGRFQPVAPIPIRRGDELGTFNLGSTVVRPLCLGSCPLPRAPSSGCTALHRRVQGISGPEPHKVQGHPPPN